jgi:hypothetical protein
LPEQLEIRTAVSQLCERFGDLKSNGVQRPGYMAGEG